MTKRAKWWTFLSVLGLALIVGVSALAAYQRKAEEDAAKKAERPMLEFTQRDVVRLRQHRLAYELTLPGTVQAISQATVRAKLAAEVRRVHVREGERVSAGQIVAEFDTAQIRSQLAERAAALESARAQLRTTERTRQTNAQLVKQNFISRNAFDSADSATRSVRSRSARTVRAPIRGIVAKRLVQPGEKVGFDAPLLAIVDLAQLEVQAQASVSDISSIRVGMTAEVLAEGAGGRKVSGRVERINPGAEPGTRTINVYVAIRNDDARLKTGTFARVVFTIAPQNEAAVLPLTALRGDEGQQHVWVIANGKLSRRSVTAGARDERVQLVEIASGLGPEEWVLASKFDNLKDGLAARVIGERVGANMPTGVAPGAAARAN